MRVTVQRCLGAIPPQKKHLKAVVTPGPAWTQARAIIAGAWVASLVIAIPAQTLL